MSALYIIRDRSDCVITITEEEYNNIKEQVNTNERLRETITRITELMDSDDCIMALEELNKEV